MNSFLKNTARSATNLWKEKVSDKVVRANRWLYPESDADCCLFCDNSMPLGIAKAENLCAKNTRAGRYCRAKSQTVPFHSVCGLFKRYNKKGGKR